MPDYLTESPKKAPTSSQTSPKSHGGTQPRKPTICPPCKPSIQKYLRFCPVEVSQNPEETPKHPKEIFIFAPFQPISAPFDLFGVLPIVQSRPMLPGAPSAALSSREAHKDRGRKKGTRERGTRERGKPSTTDQHHPPTRQQGTKERACTSGATREHGKKRQGKGAERERAEASPQAHKKGYPPHRQGERSCFPHHKFAPKNQQKVAWVVLKKFSEKFFVGMFRG